ncbi:MAG TPA: hypothetical protein VG389_25475 [Myxococcota bacterium]|nr:hypothetical protein [Myxococcota bacterium]
MTPARAPGPGRLYVLVPAAFIALMGFASVGLGAYWASTAPPRADWVAAAAWVKARLAPGDVVGVAPWWADEARLALGDGPVVALPDLASEVAAGGLWRFKRLWLVSAPALGSGAAGVGDRMAALRPERADGAARFGAVRVRLFELPAPAVPFDFVAGVAAASVRVEKDGKPWAECARPLAGGLGFECTPPAGVKPVHWMKVERDLREMDDAPRACLSVHPWAGGASLVLRWAGVPIGRVLVLEGGLPLAALREIDKPAARPVALRVLVAGKDLGVVEFPVAPGWKRLRLDTTAAAAPGTTAEVTFRVAAPDIEWRFLCVAAHLEGAP